MIMKAVVCKDARAAGPIVQAAAVAAAAHMALLHCMSGTVCKKVQVVTLTQGCSSASLALILAAGSTVSILRIRSFASADTWSQYCAAVQYQCVVCVNVNVSIHAVCSH
jgi:hypothetical protein